MKENKLIKTKNFENYQFENYFVSNFNNSAYQIIKSLSNYSKNNLVFISAATGLGKTHLIKALINKLQDKNNISVYYSNCTTLTHNLTNAIKENNKDLFIKNILSFDILIIESIEDLLNKEITQKKLIDLLDYFISNNKLVMVSSSLNPNKLIGLNNKLKSILLSDIILNIKTPLYEEKIKYIQFRTKQYRLDFSDDIYRIIAEKTPDDFRAINGVVETLNKYKEIDNNMNKEKLLKFINGFFE